MVVRCEFSNSMGKRVDLTDIHGRPGSLMHDELDSYQRFLRNPIRATNQPLNFMKLAGCIDTCLARRQIQCLVNCCFMQSPSQFRAFHFWHSLHIRNVAGPDQLRYSVFHLDHRRNSLATRIDLSGLDARLRPLRLQITHRSGESRDANERMCGPSVRSARLCCLHEARIRLQVVFPLLIRQGAYAQRWPARAVSLFIPRRRTARNRMQAISQERA